MERFTLRHWKDPFSNPDSRTALKNSLVIAGISTLIATRWARSWRWLSCGYGFRGPRPADLFVFLPLATPEVVLGAALLALFLTLNVNTGFATIVIAHVHVQHLLCGGDREGAIGGHGTST